MKLKNALCLVMLWAASLSALAEQSMLGERTIRAYWLENNSYLVVTPAVAFDTANGCDVKTSAIIPVSDPHFKYVMATVMQAMATGKVLQIYAVDCFTAWGTKFPRIMNIGLGGGSIF